MSPLFVPGSRAPPFDPREFRINDTSINVISEPLESYANMTLYGVSRFYNSRMLWHCVMDSLYPTYWTMTTYTGHIMDADWTHKSNPNYGRYIDKNNDIMVMDNFGGTDLYFLRALSDNPIIQWREWKSQKCYRNAVLGIRKTDEKASDDNALRRDGLIVKYHIDKDGVRGLRKHMLEWAETSVENCEPSGQKPLVLVVGRKPRTENDLKRKIINFDDLFNATRELCPDCDVQTIDFQKYDKKGQLRFTCNVSAIIGVHGSGLIHGAWMRPSTEAHPTAIVEIFPYKYTCRDWYYQQTQINGQEYYPIYTLHLNQSRWDKHNNPEKVERCHTLEDECLRNRCHNFLRDQSMIIMD